ncbi:MAG TPA: DNA helicase II, partial [Aeromonas sp.]|nr:DNA helicase II [Aeromonas sp.]
RSTANILKAANCVIANNSERLGKELWTEGAEGDPISLYAAFNEVDEARFVVGRLKDWKEKGGLLADCAILYRSNAQSRVLEEALMQDAMPYRIYGGLRFFERQEIKDAMAYLRLINNRGDDASFERVVNTPTRGIGDRTLEILRNNARDQGQNLWQSAKTLLNDKVLTGRAGNAVRGFVDLIDALEEQVGMLPLHQQADIAIQNSGLKAMYLAEKGEKSQARVENLDELVTACRQYQRPDELEEMSDLSAFLAHAALESGENQADEYADAVQLMTLHSAKGLEFPLVLLVGVEEGMFPSQQSTEESGRLEEERRLCYVGMTRAMEKLYICYAESRRIYGREMFHKPSRFIREMPAECLEEIRLRTQVSRPTQYGRFSQNEVQQSFDASGIKLGQRVLHPKFGEGIVLNFEGVGQQSRVQIQFDEVGAKWLVTAYARLEAL